MSSLKSMNNKEIINDILNTSFYLRSNLGLSSDNTFGIEIEFCNLELNKISKNSIRGWEIKEDSSVTTNLDYRIVGGELVSPILIDDPKTWESIKNKCDMLVSKGAVIKESAGGHIHIGSQVLGSDMNNYRRFFKMWELFENIIYYFSYGMINVPRTKIDKYAKPIGKQFYKIRNSKDGYTKYNNYYMWFKLFKKISLDKNGGINLKKYTDWNFDLDNTIEIRCPNGSLNPVVWQNNINFFIRFIVFCKSINFDEEFIDYLLSKKNIENYNLENFTLVDIDNAILLSDLIFDNRLDQLMFLKQYLKLFDSEKQKVKKNKNHSV